MTAASNASDAAIENVVQLERRRPFRLRPRRHGRLAARLCSSWLGRRRNRGRRWTTSRWRDIETTTSGDQSANARRMRPKRP